MNVTKMFCDRCGAEINERASYAWLSHRTVYAKQRLVPSQFRDDWNSSVDKYLCKKCEDGYIHWFMNPDGREE